MASWRETLTQLLGEPIDELARKKLKPVEICVIDSGIDASHPDLKGRVVAQRRIEAKRGRAPISVEVASGSNNDAYGHGTAVGGIIAAVAPNARIVDLRVLGGNSRTTPEVLIAGLTAALESEARIVNMSLAAPDSAKAKLIELLEQAYYEDRIVVAAQRNFAAWGNGWPAALASCIGVGAESFRKPERFCWQLRDQIEILAKGENITVPVPGGGYTTTFGTSFATPAVSGLCALLLGLEPKLGAADIRALLKANAAEIR